MVEQIVCTKDLVKKVFSSLFERKANNIILGAAPNTIIYSTISPEEVLTYTPDFDNAIHIVKFSEAVHDAIIRRFPVCAQAICCLDARVFSAQLNKIKYDTCSLTIRDNMIFLDYEDEGTMVLAEESCGVLISAMVVDYYLAFYQRMEKNMDDVNITPIVGVPTLVDGIFYMDLYDRSISTLKCVKKIRIPCISGLNCISVKEYLKKVVGEYTFQIKTWYEGEALRHLIEYKDGVVDVKSLQPETMWLPLRLSEIKQGSSK